MKLVIIFGPPAVGKMTVGYELAQQTGLKLFHNHMTIDLMLNFFVWGDPAFHRLVSELRTHIFEEVAQSELPGLIFTYVWDLDQEGDKHEIDRLSEIFRAQGADVCFVELEADLDQRLMRNESEFRLAQKPSKRDVERTRKNILDWENKYTMNSPDEKTFFYPEEYLKINNTHLTAGEAAQKIIDHFELEECSSEN
ncbi:MAG: AAA family ATPase [Anaerolineaceae bacterium]|nr:AAA family ATPase [Anaerolineaceae bacterium]